MQRGAAANPSAITQEKAHSQRTMHATGGNGRMRIVLNNERTSTSPRLSFASPMRSVIHCQNLVKTYEGRPRWRQSAVSI